MTEEQVPTFIPGDRIVLGLEFSCPANIQRVSAMFFNEDAHGSIILDGRPKAGERVAAPSSARVQSVVLEYNAEKTGGGIPPFGTYQLSSLEATTSGGQRIDFDNPPPATFRFEPEQHDPPRTTYWSFLFEPGHPDRPRD